MQYPGFKGKCRPSYAEINLIRWGLGSILNRKAGIKMALID